ncbi:MAG TPA: acyl-CoA reductase [Thermoanaerobaculia bacterium]|nr:acyl-CoA reductase [Thermoanaerobaculia bacterium]
MLRDFFVPRPTEPPVVQTALGGEYCRAAAWGPEALSRLVAELRRGAQALREIPNDTLLDAWSGTVEAFLDSGSPERESLEMPLAELCGLSPAGLAAGLEAVLGGVRREHAAALIEGAEPVPADSGPVLVVLSSNLPALAVQPLLPALALRRPVLLKSPSAEPLFAPAFLAALAAREPRLAEATAALTWPGGERRLETPILSGVGAVVAYGEKRTLDDLVRRAPGRVIGYGPKTSLALIGADADPEAVAAGLARDIALFDQRGCLSIAAVYTDGDPEALAESLWHALLEESWRLPAGLADAATLAAVQQVRLEAEMRGLAMPEMPVAAGTVLVDPDTTFRLSPGLRTVRIHPVDNLARVPWLLARWKDRLQGAALAGEEAWELADRLRKELGISRCAMPGDLQSPDATWHNGGISPLEALRGVSVT